MQPYGPTTTYLHPVCTHGIGPETRLLHVTDDFWQTLDQRTDLHRGRLMIGLTNDADWDVWEMHPAGTWHTADTLGPAHMLIITWGEGTQHRPR